MTNSGSPACRRHPASSRGSAPPPASRPSFFTSVPIDGRQAERPGGVGPDEVDDLAHLGGTGEHPRRVLQPLLEGALRAEQLAEGAAQVVDRLTREAATLQAD